MTSLYARLLRIPILGWVLRWLVAAVTLPVERARLRELQIRMEGRMARLEHNVQQLAASAEQLVELHIEPTVLRNLGESVPVSLRAMRRDLDSLRAQINERNQLEPIVVATGQLGDALEEGTL